MTKTRPSVTGQGPEIFGRGIDLLFGGADEIPQAQPTDLTEQKAPEANKEPIKMCIRDRHKVRLIESMLAHRRRGLLVFERCVVDRVEGGIIGPAQAHLAIEHLAGAEQLLVALAGRADHVLGDRASACLLYTSRCV